MFPDHLEPRLDLLRAECVLVQAWKKTASYIRYHNWFSDTLALDVAAVNLPAFLGALRERLQSPEDWQNTPLRLVPAPKSQRWRVREGAWEPEKGARSARLRPLAHVDLSDQVVATATMLCLGDRVETLQGDPRWPVRDSAVRRQLISYGNRLFCDEMGTHLRHRWGSARLYRAYYQDYRAFLSRPEVAANSTLTTGRRRAYVVQADLRQFFDRVRPHLLADMINRIRQDDDDPDFYALASSVLDWGWDDRDQTELSIYTKQTGLEDYTRIALPQGLVASGFFANVVLMPFDNALRSAIRKEVIPGILLADACRYVDDFRLLVEVDPTVDGPLERIETLVSNWLGLLLEEHATGLALSPEKTRAAALNGDERALVRQSARMERVQSAVSGGFDALGGVEILDAIQGLMRAQEALSVGDDDGWRLSPVPDVREETVARFGAARFRTTFRSIRPLLYDTPDEFQVDGGDKPLGGRLRVARTRRELDEDVKAFALGLIRRWVIDPSNVRLLRIGLDLWADVEVLHEVLALLRPFVEKGGRRGAPRRVAWYCLAEVLRAGATETGFVAENESLPAEIDLTPYREALRREAADLVSLPGQRVPWYVRQQALMFLAAYDPTESVVEWSRAKQENESYWDLIRFLRGDADGLSDPDFATFAVLARRAFVDREGAVELTRPRLNPSRMAEIAQRDPSFLLEIAETEAGGVHLDGLPARLREDLCQTTPATDDVRDTLAEAVLSTHPTGPLRNELSLLRLATAFLEQWGLQDPQAEVITPGQVMVSLKLDQPVADIRSIRIYGSPTDKSGSLYEVAPWCEPSERWRFQLGFLLRFILSGQPDFTRPVRRMSWKEAESCYRPAESHWYQRLYGLYNGQAAFGDDWLPVTDWLERFLLALLRWPGCRVPKGFDWVEDGLQAASRQIQQRVADLSRHRGKATRALMLPLVAGRPTPTDADRPLRACVVQTVVPVDADFQPVDLTLDSPVIRRKHRNHLSAVLAAVERMLALRATHMKGETLLDWLILPELAVHPNDVRTHLVPFARTHRAIILAGLTYEQVVAGKPLVNSALWVIPEWSDADGLQIRIRRQGKAHLAPNEQAFNVGGPPRVHGFRPCQWLIGYPWSSGRSAAPIWLTAAVCYDATDLGLAADLRESSDVLAVPALNKDVRTFDQMALALHYHMFQLVVVANNGQYGGSNAYWPRSDPHIRRVFHTHGQPQASISFLEIDNIAAFLQRRQVSGSNAKDWKHPPAGLIRHD